MFNYVCVGGEIYTLEYRYQQRLEVWDPPRGSVTGHCEPPSCTIWVLRTESWSSIKAGALLATDSSDSSLDRTFFILLTHSGSVSFLRKYFWHLNILLLLPTHLFKKLRKFHADFQFS